MQPLFALGLLLLVALLAAFSLLRRSSIPPTMLRRGALVALASVGFLGLTALAPRLWWLWLGMLGIIVGQTLSSSARQSTGFGSARRSSGGESSGCSEIETDYLSARLDHGTGEMFIRVLKGQFEGADIADLSLYDLLELLGELHGNDEDGAQVLAAYLHKMHPGWESAKNARSERNTKESSGMTLSKAYEVLGLKPPVTRDEVIQAHRRLINRVHPDRGGSSYLAAEINRAKDTLLTELS